MAPGESETRLVTIDGKILLLGADHDTVTFLHYAEHIVEGLRALLAARGYAPPYVLVGHSVGGLFARLYASRYPDQVAGLVLVDASHEEQEVRRAHALYFSEFAKRLQAGEPDGLGLFGEGRGREVPRDLVSPRA